MPDISESFSKLSIKSEAELFASDNTKKVHVIPPENYITPDVLSAYEIASILSLRSAAIGAGGTTFLNNDDLFIKVEDYNSNMSGIVVRKDDEDLVRITNTAEIVKRELNKRKCPLLIERTVHETDTEKWVELRDPNTMLFPVVI